MDTNQYMGMFLEESREHLQTLNQNLLELENDPSDLSVLDEIFRSAHTIKGMSATMGFTQIAELTHEMENVLDLLRKSVLNASEVIVNTLFRCVDTLEQLVESVSNNTESDIEIAPLIQKLHQIAKGESGAGESAASPQVTATAAATATATASGEPLSTMEFSESEKSVILQAQQQGLVAYEIQVKLRDGCILKSARAYMVMSALEEMGEVFKAVPAAEELERENFELSFQVFLVTGNEADKIQQTVLNISEVDTAQVLVCEMKVPEVKAAPVAAATSASTPQNAAPAPKKPAGAPKGNDNSQKLKSGQSVRVDIDKLDSLLNLVGELVINKTRLEQIGITHKLTDLVETIEQMDRVTTDLQNVVMKVRMVPVGQVFNRFPRMVRDLSHELNKEINLIIQGEETELDRTVIDEIGDPLVHLLRNSIDHGIEHPEEREAQGKNPVGEVRLIASHEGNNVIIMVEDDGKGINPEVIKRKAVEKGLVTQADVDKMDPNEAVRMVFYPGFSTA
ncbi:MAG: chemotaxis protein CheA, partial [Sporomusaceae bacterium]|nr:chemotaxis protein CheA [Sporomusaceae bacterium]